MLKLFLIFFIFFKVIYHHQSNDIWSGLLPPLKILSPVPGGSPVRTSLPPANVHEINKTLHDNRNNNNNNQIHKDENNDINDIDESVRLQIHENNDNNNGNGENYGSATSLTHDSILVESV